MRVEIFFIEIVNETANLIFKKMLLEGSSEK
jgi:hypothetical protein